MGGDGQQRSKWGTWSSATLASISLCLLLQGASIEPQTIHKTVFVSYYPGDLSYPLKL